MKRIDKYEFMPSALEVTEKPTSPLGSTVIWTIFILLLSFILWSCIAKVDIVATASGKIIPSGKIKVVQPLEEGVVKNIYIEEGDIVKEGQLLLELDTIFKDVDIKNIGKLLELYKVEKEIINGKNDIDVKELSLKHRYIGKDEVEEQYKNFLLKERELSESLEVVELSILRLKSNLYSREANLLKLKNSLILLNEEEKSLLRLKDIGGVKEKEWLRKKEEKEVIEYEIKGAKHEVEAIKIEIDERRKSLENIISNAAIESSNRSIQLGREILNLEGNLNKIKSEYQLKKLYSPSKGRINEIAITTIGAVVSPGKPLITLVPTNTPLIVELMVLNKDIGFIELKQDVEIKLDTFPFQKYGTLKGKVINVSPDAFEDKTRGLVYKVKVAILKNEVLKSGGKVEVKSGMSVVGEVKTGKRRVIDFFLSPIIKYSDESLKVR